MSLVIRDTSSVPGEGWVFPVKQTGFTVRVPSYGLLYDAVVAHCVANQVPPPSQQEIVNYLCAHVHSPCYDSETRVPLVNLWSQGVPLAPTSCCSKSNK